MHKQSQIQKGRKIIICHFKKLGCCREVLNSRPLLLPALGCRPLRPMAHQACLGQLRLWPCPTDYISGLLSRALSLLTIPEGEGGCFSPHHIFPGWTVAICKLPTSSHMLPQMTETSSKLSHGTGFWLKFPCIERWERAFAHSHWHCQTQTGGGQKAFGGKQRLYPPFQATFRLP